MPCSPTPAAPTPRPPGAITRWSSPHDPNPAWKHLDHAHLWDSSAVAALDKVILKFRRNGVAVRLVGVNQASKTLLDLLGVHDRPAVLASDETHRGGGG